MVIWIIIGILVFLGILAVMLNISANILEYTSHDERCDRCGNDIMYYLGLENGYIYYKCNKCGTIKKIKL